MHIDSPTPDKAAILVALAVLFTSDAVIELRSFQKGKKRTDAGYFDASHWSQLAEHAVRLSASGAAVYITLNPVDPQLLSRYSNRIEAYASVTTNDKQVVCRRWLLIDIDPTRPSGTSATDVQFQAAKDKVQEIRQYLSELHWPAPVVAQSGNGYHLLYAIDLPNDDEATVLVKGVLSNLGDRFDDAQIKVDRTVFNAARICKLYGTVANKGDNTSRAPWRLSKLLEIPERTVVSAEQLEQLAPIAGKVTASATPHTATPTSATPSNGSFGLEDFLTRHSLAHTRDQHEGRERFKLASCPFNPEHIDGEAAIFRKPSGALGFKCQHTSCEDKGWRHVRELLDGPRPGPRQSQWPEPTPLPNALPSVDRFDAELLPQALRPWIMDIAHRMQCPADFAATAALAGISSLIGARAVVRPKERDDWQVVPNLWGVIVGRPGVKKSPALNEALKPLNRLQGNEFELWKISHEEWAIDSKLVTMQNEANEKKAKAVVVKDPAAARALLSPVEAPAEPQARRYIVNDATVEKLGEIMEQNPWGVLSYRDELYGLLTSLDKQGQEGSRAFYLTSYDGNQSYTYERIIRGTTHIPRVCLAMIGGIQPGRIQEYVRGAVAGGSADDGLLQRFGLAVWPDVDGEFIHVDEWPDTAAKQAAWAVYERLGMLQPQSETEPTVWRFTPEAQELFVQWLVPFETEIRGDTLHPAMVSHLAKYRKLIPALALTFALIDTPNEACLIGEAELLRALAWGDYLRTHANRLYAAAVMPEMTDAATLLGKLKTGKLTDRDGMILGSFTPRQIALKGWSGLGTPQAVRKAADVLADYDWLRPETLPGGPTGGRPSDRYLINPGLFSGGAS
ncbi:MAG: DUF3987 domain-containing protein [Comamonadaceae bacterium]|nr:MAG: DUF3987 domain-containing protein [Comamonadaceae bacterium]